MQGFPPPDDRIIGYPASDYFSFPRLRWTFCHFREIQATKRVGRGMGPVSPLAEALDPAIDELTFTPIGATEEMTSKASLEANYTDGMLILHRGAIVYEYYSGCLDREGRHGAMSVTKSFVGTVAEILIAEGELNDSKLVSDYVPELKSSAFGNATVREVMDMTTGLDYNENYADPESDIWLYAAAGDPTPKPESYKGPRNFYEFLQGVEPEGTHGEAFIYKSINTDALAWVIARATGKDFIEHLAERIWKPLGMEQEADMMIDSLGTPFSPHVATPFLPHVREECSFFCSSVPNSNSAGPIIVTPIPPINAGLAEIFSISSRKTCISSILSPPPPYSLGQ